MRVVRIALFLFILFAVALSLLPATQSSAALPVKASALSKIAPWVLQRTEAGGRASILVVLAQQADTSAAGRLPTKLEKGRYVYETRSRLAQQTQAPLLALLDSKGVAYRSFYIVNAINIEADRELVLELALREEVARIEGNPWVSVNLPTPEERTATAELVNATIEWGVSNINAPAVWGEGFDGTGIVVAGEDTGYRWTHEQLKSQYRGWDGTNTDHNYNWYDPIPLPGPACAAHSPEPCDDHGHGTHTMGTMVGGDGAGPDTNDIGIAYGAKWIGCRNMVQGLGAPDLYIACHEFMLAPHDLNGEHARPELAPHVINNSWGCVEACPPDVLRESVEALVDAGIVYVASAGNDGPLCSTVLSPPATYEASFSVAAHDVDNQLTSFSSRGPVLVDGSERRKPDISGPGRGVRSAWGGADDEYDVASGTSMAGPHVAGAVALLLDAHPSLIGNIDGVRQALQSTANPGLAVPHGLPECGGIHYTTIPNNHFGYGRVDIAAAVDSIERATYHALIPLVRIR